MRALVITALLSSGCSLIVDTDAVRAKRDGGVVASRDASTPGADARPESDPDASQPDAPTFADAAASPDAAALGPDAAPVSSCPARMGAAPLTCAPPVRVVSGGLDLYSPSIDGLADGFMSAISEQGAVVRRKILLDGTIAETERYPTRARPESVAVTTQGASWALAFVPAGGGAIECRSSVATSSATRITPASRTDGVSLAMSPLGKVAIGAADLANTIALQRAISDQPGCPTTAVSNNPSFFIKGVTTVSVPGTENFRFVISSFSPNTVDSAIVGIDDAPTMADEIFTLYDGLGMREIATVPVPGGVYMASVWINYDGTTAALGAMLNRTDLELAPPVDRAIAPDVYDFDLTACGPGCLAAAYAVEEGRGRISVTFFSDDVGLTILGTEPEQDAACTLAAMGAELDLAYSSGKIAILYTQGTRADLYVCDKPNL